MLAAQPRKARNSPHRCLLVPVAVGAAVSEELAEIIREEIRRDGPIPFSRWMELCLYHPQYGYYMKERPDGRRITGAGPDADFVTPPTLHPFLGQAVGREIQASWRTAGRPKSFTVLEFGGGEGDLATHALSWIDSNEKELSEGVRWAHAEISPSHLRAQHKEDGRIGWYRIDETGYEWQVAGQDRPDFVMACEFLDALPIDLFERDGNQWLRVHAAETGDGFAEALLPADEPLFTSAPRPGAPRVASLDGATARWCQFVAESICRTVLVIDYGQRHAWPATRAFRGHQPAPIFLEPGESDLTSNVDFSRIAAMIESGPDPRLHEASFESLEHFLLRHGILDELNRIDRSTVEGASSYLRLRQLLLPTGMGAAFKVQRFDRVPSGTSASPDST
jgi:SAM-dependent MidA family methyltransferase